MYNWQRKNMQGAGPVIVLFWGTLGTQLELVGSVYNVNKLPGPARVLPQHSPEGLAGGASTE